MNIAIIYAHPSMFFRVSGDFLISHQVRMLKKYGVEDIIIADGEKEKAKNISYKIIHPGEVGRYNFEKYNGIFLVNGNLFLEEDFLEGFQNRETTVFIDKSNQEKIDILYITREEFYKIKSNFHSIGELISHNIFKKHNVTGKVWKKIEDETDLFYAEKKLSLLKERENLKSIKLFSFDLDGTTILGKRPIEGVEKFLKYLKDSKRKYCFLTNNSSRTNKIHAKYLSEIFGFSITEENIMSSIDLLEDYLEEHNIKTIYPFVNNLIKEHLSQKIKFSEENPEIIVVGFNTDATYPQMYKVSELIFKGVPYILIHPDFRCPTEFGYIPDAGSFGKMFELTTDKKPMWIGGKPNPIMVDGLSKKYKILKEDIAYIGDRLYTDIEMAHKANIYGFLVLTGETSLRDFYEYTLKKEDNYDKIFIVDNLIFLKEFLKRK